jgi:hypothetical protein
LFVNFSAIGKINKKMGSLQVDLNEFKNPLASITGYNGKKGEELN